MRKRRKLLHLLALCCATLMSPVSDAQDSARGSIDGEVSDSLGAGLADVNVSAFKRGTAPLFTAKTDGNGAFRLDLPSGTYTVEFSAVGFKKTDFEHVAVRSGESLRISVLLETGPEDELVQREWVVATAAPDPTDRDPEATEEEVTDIPLASRNYTQAAGLASGVSSQVSNATAMGLNSQGVQAGSSPTNNYMMDGIAVATQNGDSDTPAVPNPDAIEARQVQSWTYSAGPERYAGATIGVTTKSGTNAFHGTLFEFIRNDVFNANEFFIKRKRLPKPVLKQNQFGFTFGGPVRKNRVFFFLAYQGTRQSNGLASAGYAPSATLPPLPNIRTAAAIGAAFCPSDHPGDNRYSTLYGGVQVACDGSNINPVAINILNLKLPNGEYAIPGSNNGTFQTVPHSIPASFREDQAIFNSDYVIAQKHRLTQKFYYSHAPQVSNFTGGSTALPGAKMNLTSEQINAQVRLNSTLTPKLLNELLAYAQRGQLSRIPENPFTNEQVGIASPVATINLLDIINVSGLFAFGGTTQWDSTKYNVYMFADRVSYTHGKHSVRFGVEMDKRQFNTHSLAHARGLLTFQRFPDLLLGLPGCPPGAAGCSVANPVVNGIVTNGSPYSNVYGSLGPGGGSAFVIASDGIKHSYRYSDASFYLQDSIQLYPRLTINAGLRWDYLGLPTDSTGNMSNFWPSLTSSWSVPQSAGTYVGFAVPSNYQGTMPAGVTRNGRITSVPRGASSSNFAPRVGFSLQPLHSSSMVVRGGYGMFYDRSMSWDTLQQSIAAVPYAVPVGGIGQANYQASLATPFRTATLGWGAPRSVDLIAGESSNLSLYILDENFRTPLTHKWNLEIQQQLPLGIMMNIGYAGAHSIHLQNAIRQLNVPDLASPTHPVYGITQSTVKNASMRVPYLGLAPNGLNADQTQGSAKYNGLQASVAQRSSNGLRIQASYMFSKTLSNLGAAPSTTGGGNGNGLSSTGMNSNNPLDARQQYGPAPTAAPQRLALNYGWDLPIKLHGFSGKILNGWGFSGTAVIQSGTPMTISDSRGGSIYGNVSISRAQFCPGMGPKNAATPGGVKDRLNGYFDKSAFCVPPPISDGTGFGNSSVGFIRGPGQTNVDFSVTRGVELKGSKIEFRIEFFNVFNHAQFSPPNANVSDGTFGQISGTSVNPRLIQFALKYSF